MSKEKEYVISAEIIKDFCSDAIQSGRLPSDKEIDNLLFRYNTDNFLNKEHIDGKEKKEEVNKIVFKIGMAIQKISLSLDDYTLERIKDYLKEIEDGVLEIAKETKE